ncbi:MAG: hypothetical protein FD170_761 [Bacteroidetes bacterium]|nr:MAG: hypothetical protein FD170_761 [Bacteroidota bacterium]
MSGAERIAISAAIGGTAEALGGGKFANGAVTGAYVMALNHMMHSDKWHPTRGEAAEATSTRTETTGNEASYLVYIDECGDEYYWEVPADPRDGPGVAYFSRPEDARGLTLVENYHYSKDIITDQAGNTGRTKGSYLDWQLARDYNIKVTHHTLGVGMWIFKPSVFFQQPISFLFDRKLLGWDLRNPIKPTH